MSPRIAEFLHRLKILALVILPLLGTVAAVVLLWNRYVFPRDLVLLIAMYMVTTMGVTIGYHRMLTHQGFQASFPLRMLFLVCGCMALEGAPDVWAATHIRHHAHSDEEGDPHSPLEGFWHAHMGWLFLPRNFEDAATYAPHLLTDPAVRLVSRSSPLWFACTFLIPLAIGGWTGLLWGGFVRAFLTTHVTWSVNSICHTFGRRPFETTDESRNNWLIGLLGFGEGWHNNHHAFPRNAFHGLHWWQFDLSGLLIRAFEALGLVWAVERVKSETMKAHQRKAEGMRQTLEKLRADLVASILTAERELQVLLQYSFQKHLSEASLAESVARCERALRRLADIHASVRQAAHLKRQRLAAYGKEVAELVGSVKERFPRSSGLAIAKA